MGERSDGFADWMRAIRAASFASPDDVLMLLGGLRQLTDWDEDVLCRHLGCRGIQIDPERAAHSVAYLTWVTDLCRLVDPSRELVRSRREVVVGAFELCDGAGGPLPERVGRCREAMQQPVGDDFSALVLLELGEISEAWRQAARALPDGLARAAQDRFDLRSPQLRTAHLHPRRLELLLTGDAQEIQLHIGATVALRMHTHLSDCSRCQALADELDLRKDRLNRAPLLARVA